MDQIGALPWLKGKSTTQTHRWSLCPVNTLWLSISLVHLPGMITQWRRICLGLSGTLSESPKPRHDLYPWAEGSDTWRCLISSGQILESFILRENWFGFQWKALKIWVGDFLPKVLPHLLRSNSRILFVCYIYSFIPLGEELCEGGHTNSNGIHGIDFLPQVVLGIKFLNLSVSAFTHWSILSHPVSPSKRILKFTGHNYPLLTINIF